MNGGELVICNSGCGHSFEIESDFIGTTVHCPYCAKLMVA